MKYKIEKIEEIHDVVSYISDGIKNQDKYVIFANKYKDEPFWLPRINEDSRKYTECKSRTFVNRIFNKGYAGEYKTYLDEYVLYHDYINGKNGLQVRFVIAVKISDIEDYQEIVLVNDVDKVYINKYSKCKGIVKMMLNTAIKYKMTFTYGDINHELNNILNISINQTYYSEFIKDKINYTDLAMNNILGIIYRAKKIQEYGLQQKNSIQK